MSRVIAAYGGGFKPPTAGHFEIVDTALEKYPEIDEFMVYVGGKVRDGIDQTEAILVWDIYQNYLANKVKIEPVKSPIGEILRLAKNNPQDTIYFVIGYRDGRQDDLDDVEARTGNISKKYPNIEVKVIPTYNPNMSGTNARKALDQSEEEFIKFLPSKVKEKSEIFQILRPPVNEKKDPKKGTGKKPEGSKRRLYTDEDPKDTIGIKFSTRQDIVDTLNKKSFKAKSHARQSQIINLIHQRVRAAYGRAKDPAVKKRLKSGLDYITKKKEASKAKTQRLKKLKEGDTYEKMAAKGKKAGSLKQGTVRKRLGIPKDKKIPLSLINKEISRLKKMDKDPDKKGAQLGDKNQKYYKALQLSKTLKTTTNINEEITKSQLDSIEVYADKLFAKLGIDIEFTRHFLDRVNDKRNNKPISVAELMGMFKRLHKKHGKPLSKIDNDFDAVVKDFNNNINIPFAINVTPNDIDLVAKTVMRKKDFKTSTPVIALEGKLTEDISVEEMESFAEGRGDGAETIADNAKEKGGNSMLTYHHFKVKAPYYKKATDGNFNKDEFTKDYKGFLEELYEKTKDGMNIKPIAFQELMGKIEVLGELLVENKEPLNEQEEDEGNRVPEAELILPRGKKVILQAEDIDYKRGLIVELLDNGGYEMAYWYDKPNKPYPVEILVDGQSIKDDGKVVEMKFHPQDYYNKQDKLNENATYSKSIDVQGKIIELTKHMLDKGMNIEPLPTVEFVDGDSENASDFFGRTAYYDPDKSHIVLYTEGRHPKDIVRSFAHEMVHHIQNLENRLGNITTTDTTEDSELDQIEREAYLNGNMTFRNWTDSIDGDVSTSLTEGKYDSLVTKLSGFTLNSWKGDFKDGANQGYFELEIGPGREFDYPHLNFNYKAKANFVDYYKTGGLARPRKKMPEVIIEYWLDTDELPRMWSQIAMSLRNTIRHEIEHLMQSGINTKQGKEMGDDSREREELMTGKKPWWKIWRKTLGTPEYYKLEKEVDANLQGLYLKAKKIRQPLEQVIDNYVKYELNLPIEDQEEIKRIWAERAPKLNIPLEENKDYFGLNQFVKEVAEEILISEEEVVSSPSMKYKIYSDMDGVLTDFDKSFEKYSKGIPPREYEKKYGKDKFWELIDGKGKVGFWVGMPWMEDGKQYWDYIKDYNTELLSSPSRSSTSRLGKRLWVKNNMPGVKLTLAQASAKQNYAAPNHILIDDRKSNIDQWRSQGGIGILHTSAADTIQQLKKLGL